MANNELAPIDRDSMIQLVSTIFAELNIGMLIYQVEDSGEPSSLRLLFANKAASGYTGADLSERVGQLIFEAFPALEGSEVAPAFLEVSESGRSRNLGSFEYPGDQGIERSYYSVKAFPMPAKCVGVAFENITLRKKLENIVSQQSQK